jgi:NAD(P)H-dependent FMN reductase
VNCLAQLRLVCLALGGLPIPEQLPVANVQELFDEAGRLIRPELRDRLSRFLADFVWYAVALQSQRMQQGLSAS